MDTPIIPGFEIIATLPRGGMSTVYKARQISLDRIVALKTLPPALDSESTDINQFLSEARITANLKHPNIIQVYDFGKTVEGVYYFVMEFVSGYSLGQWIRRKNHLSEENALLAAQSVAEALNYAWQTAQVVHCDIKPDNVMIDGDGTVKVADLGLARSIRSALDESKAIAGMVVGTPNYISPEQSRGDPQLDCRADIYSLGATLYHCMTGKMPFEEAPALTAMDLQLTDQIPDAYEVNPHISVAAASLIERMLAKERDHRQANWEELLTDIKQVLNHQMPLGELPPDGISTMRRSPSRGQRPAVKAMRPTPTPEANSQPSNLTPESIAFRNIERHFALRQRNKNPWQPEGWFIVTIILALLLLGGLMGHKLWQRARLPELAKGLEVSSEVAEPSELINEEAEASDENNIAGLLAFANQWAAANPAQPTEAIRHFEQVINSDTNESHYSQLAAIEIQKLENVIQQAVAAVMQSLDAQAQTWLAKNEFDQAADYYEQYQGAWSWETAAERGAKIRALRQSAQELRQQQQEMAEATNQQWQQWLEQLSERLLSDNPAAALEQAQQAGQTAGLAPHLTDINGLIPWLTEAAQIEQRILAAYQALKDQEVSLQLTNGVITTTIRGVQDNRIQAEKIFMIGSGQISQPQSFQLLDLALAERLQRLGPEKKPEVFLMRGILAAQAQDWAAAAALAKTGPLLSGPLLAKLEELQVRHTEQQARDGLLNILRNLPIKVSPDTLESEQCLTAISQKTFPARKAQLLTKALAGYQKKFGQTKFAQQHAPILQALSQALTPKPTAPAEASSASAPQAAAAPTDLRALLQPPTGMAAPQALLAQMLERNPGLEKEAIVVTADEAGQIDRIEIFSSALKDIRPLRVLAKLRVAICSGNSPDTRWKQPPPSAPLSDLTPLKGMDLRELDISYTMVRDISALFSMPLDKLSLERTKIGEITYLKGMPLSELNLAGTRVRDIKVLHEMPLRRLILSETDVTDITPLKDVPLNYLNLAKTKVRNLSPLNQAPLLQLDISDTDIKDLTLLKSMPLRSLYLTRAKTTDYSFLANLKLINLRLEYTDIRDFTVLKDMPLRVLDLSGTKIRDRDLIWLQDLPLERLALNKTAIKDLTPLKKMTSLRSLAIQQIPAKDLTPLLDLPIENIWLDDELFQPGQEHWCIPILQSIPTLQLVNGQLWLKGTGQGSATR